MTLSGGSANENSPAIAAAVPPSGQSVHYATSIAYDNQPAGVGQGGQRLSRERQILDVQTTT
jgi:hypothetical protein